MGTLKAPLHHVRQFHPKWSFLFASMIQSTNVFQLRNHEFKSSRSVKIDFFQNGKIKAEFISIECAFPFSAQTSGLPLEHGGDIHGYRPSHLSIKFEFFLRPDTATSQPLLFMHAPCPHICGIKMVANLLRFFYYLLRCRCWGCSMLWHTRVACPYLFCETSRTFSWPDIMELSNFIDGVISPGEHSCEFLCSASIFQPQIYSSNPQSTLRMHLGEGEKRIGSVGASAYIFKERKYMKHT